MRQRPWSGRRVAAISDLDDGWRRVLARGVHVLWYDDDRAARLHPGLVEALADLGPTVSTLAAPVRPVRVDPLGRREERRLARAVLPILPRDSVRWYTFADAPTSWWVDRAAENVKLVRPAAEIVLDRPPIDHLELIDVLLNRSDEMSSVTSILDGMADEDDEPADDGPLRVPPVVAGIVEDALFALGWRLEHPAVRGVLVGPGGERVDALALVAYGDDGTADLTALGNVLRR